jgi:polyhydroxybutyrate depolymerase
MKRRFLLAFIAILISVPACSRMVQNTPGSSAMPAGDSTRTLNHDGIERSYLLHVPPGYNETLPTAVVLVFHGGGGNAENAARMTGFDAQADQAGFLVVYPNGTGRLGDKVLTWNGGTCCGYAQENNVDDVGFVRAIIADLQGIAAIDTKRIYATGMSNGGIMAYRLACEASDLIAAIGSASGTQNIVPCEPQEPVSVIHFHGTNDQHLPYAGGVGVDSLTGVNYASVQDSIQFWLDFDQCPPTATIEEFADIQHSAYTSCAQGSGVELYTIVGGGHAWPGSSGPAWIGGDQPTMTISATSIIWEFFSAHPKP